MTEAILGLVIVALLVERYLSSRAHEAETGRLIAAALAKTPGEYSMMVQAEEPRRLPVPSELPEGFTGIAGLS